MTARVPPPTRRPSVVQKVRLGSQAVFLGHSAYPDGRCADLWIDAHRTGSGLRGLMSSLGRTISLGLQHGVPVAAYVETLSGLAFPPHGPVTGHGAIVRAESLADLVAQELEWSYPCES